MAAWVVFALRLSSAEAPLRPKPLSTEQATGE
jgi:hypothetical protein